jgi:hypothetical protein
MCCLQQRLPNVLQAYTWCCCRAVHVLLLAEQRLLGWWLAEVAEVEELQWYSSCVAACTLNVLVSHELRVD